MVLVVGATGQLGTAVVKMLLEQRFKVRIFVRKTSNYKYLKDLGAELCFGDLRDTESINKACRGVKHVIATANSIVPIGSYSFEETEGDGYDNLIRACQKEQIHQFVFMSVPETQLDVKIPSCQFKRINETRLQESGIPYTIFQASLLMDSWLSLIGSSIPLRGAVASTLERPFWFSRLFMKGVGSMIEKRSVAIIPGNGMVRHAFIAIDDAAKIIVKSIDHPQARNAIIKLGGPENLTWNDIVDIFSRVLNKDIRAIHFPSWLYRFQQLALSAVSPAASNIMGLNWLLSSVETAFDTEIARSLSGGELTTVEAFLVQKLSLPES